MKKFTALVLVFMIMLTSLPMESISFAEEGYTDLIISEYIEGSAQNKAIEIFNGTSETIDLSNYSIQMYTNDKLEVGLTIPLRTDANPTIASGATLVVSHDKAAAEILAVAAITSKDLGFNGNESLLLVNNGSLIDSIGHIGSKTNDAKDKTLRRKISAKQGDTDTSVPFDFNAMYEDVGKDILDGIGHYEGVVNVPAPAYTNLMLTEYIEGSSFNKAVEIYNGTSTSVDLSEYTLELYSGDNLTVQGSTSLDAGPKKILAPGDLLVISHKEADQVILDLASFLDNNTINFNGDDELVLKHKGLIIDSLGMLGASNPTFGRDKTLRRDLSVLLGDTDLADENVLLGWTEHEKNNFDDLGKYNGSTIVNPVDPDPVDPDPVDPDPVDPVDPDPVDPDPVDPVEPLPDFDMAAYYQRAEGKTGEALKAALNTIISEGHVALSYSEAYNALYHTDHADGPKLISEFDASADNNVVLFYTGELMNGPDKYADNSGWNREHVWAKSHGKFGTARGPGTDIHQLRPTDIKVNSKRGHLDFDESDNHYVAGNYVDSDSWEPRDAVKGDVARILFYMAVRYEGNDYLDLELSESLNSYGETDSNYGEHGKLSTLLKWNIEDPVDAREQVRNNVVYADYQHNRNPFVDHPEYVSMVFGGETVDPIDPKPVDPVVPVSGAKIYDIQGASHVSLLDGKKVEDVVGVVTAKLNYKFDRFGSAIKGFYIQDQEGDGDFNTSDAIFVASDVAVDLGDLVAVTGQVNDYVKSMDFYAYDQENQLSVTSIDATKVDVLSSNNALPAPVKLGQGGRIVPHDLIASPKFESFDATTYAADFYESLEGMRVTVENPLVVSAYINRVVGVVADNGAVAKADDDVSITQGVILEKDDVNTEIILVNGAIKPVTSAKHIHMGATFDSALVGVLDYEWTNYQLYITEDLPSFTQPSFQRQSFKYDASDDELTIGSYNVYNHSADDPASKTRGIANQIVNDMKSPDIIGLCEVQDNNGKSGDNLTDASKTYKGFIDGIKAAGGPTYEWIDIDPVYNAEGGEPNGNIRVGFLYNPDRVNLVDGIKGKSTQTVSVDSEGHLSLNPGRIAATAPAFDGTRKSLAAEFEFKGESIIVVMNHLKSKGGDNGIYGNVQTPVLKSEEKRIEQAALVNAFVDQVLDQNPDANVVVMGDMNDFQFSAPLQAMKGDVLVNMVDQLDKSERFSYTFNGNAQVLDHILVTKNLLDQTQADILNINSYLSKDDKANKHSDHDPIMVKISGLKGVVPAVYPVLASHRGEVAKDTSITLSSRTPQAAIYYAVDGDLDLDNLSNNTLYEGSILVDKAMTLQVVAYKDDTLSSVKTYNFTLAPDIVTIAEAKALKLGSDVVVEAYLTSQMGVLGNQTFFFADHTGGSYSHNSDAYPDLVIGSKVRIKGVTDNYLGMDQINITSLEALGQDKVMEAKEISAADFGEAYESNFVKIKGTLKSMSADKHSNEYMVVTVDGLDLKVKLDNRAEVADFTKLFTVGDQVVVQGNIYDKKGDYSLILRKTTDVKVIKVITIQEAKDQMTTDETVIVEGLVTMVPGSVGNKSFTFQDATAGAYVYTKVLPEGVTLGLGDKIRLTGKTKEYKGLLQFEIEALEVVGQGTVESQEINIGGINESTESEFVNLKALEISKMSKDKYNNTYFEFTSKGQSVSARLDARAGLKFDGVSELYAVGDQVNLKGLVYQSGEKYTLTLRTIEDLEIAESTKITNIQFKDLNNTSIEKVAKNSFFYVGADIEAGQDQKGVLIFKVEKDNKMLRVAMMPNAGQKGYLSGFDTFGFESGMYDLKVFYWNSLETMTPLADHVTYTFEVE